MTTKKIEEVEETPITEYHRYRLIVEGITPVIWNRKMTDFRKPHIAPKVKKDDAEVQWATWRDKLHVKGQNNRVYFPVENIHEALIGGAKYWGAKLSNKFVSDMVKRGIVCEPLEIYDHEGKEVFKDSPSILPLEKEVRTGRVGSVVYTVRPMLAPGWRGETIIHVWDPRLSQDIMTSVARFTGQYNGIGDFRKYYGRFTVKELREEPPNGTK